MGDGYYIDLWRDKWVPGLEDGILVVDQPPVGCNMQKVNNIIVRGRWDLGAIIQWISEPEKRAIRCIPISQGGSMDRLVWCGVVTEMVAILLKVGTSWQEMECW